MKSIILYYSFLIIFFLLIFYTLPAQNRPIKITGNIYDKSNQMPVYDATVTLLNGSSNPSIVGTDTKGKFKFDSVISRGNFSVKVDKDNYESYTSQAYSINSNQINFVIDRIDLVPITHNLENRSYTINTLVSNNILPTDGAKELFYTLNPELRNKDSIESNYKIRPPEFPKINKSIEDKYDKEFKQKKRLKNPDIAGNGFIFPFLPNDKIWPFKATAGISLNPEYTNDDFFNNYRDNPEKFVFVIWKKDQNGKAVLKGPEVEGRFLVYYYPTYLEGDTLRYHKADNATYGYAMLWNVHYKIIIKDIETNQTMNILGNDNVIEPDIFFEKKDIFTMLNSHLVWIKIPIQISE